MIFDETYTMNNGESIPKFGLGTWFIDDGKAAEAVQQAVKIGYRNFDSRDCKKVWRNDSAAVYPLYHPAWLCVTAEDGKPGSYEVQCGTEFCDQ